MAIKFEFTVSDIDAENIMGCIRDRINSNNEEIMSEMCRSANFKEDSEEKKESDKIISWYRGNSAYLEELKTKMKNSYVD